jgi:hypothetical protein
MFSLHDTMDPRTFFGDDILRTNMLTILKSAGWNKSGQFTEDILQKLEDPFLKSRSRVQRMSLGELKESYAFLIRCGLVSATPIFHDFDHSRDVLRDLESEEDAWKNKKEFFHSVNFTISYPMFYVEILKELLGAENARNVQRDVLGSIMECQARALLPQDCMFEFRKVKRQQKGEQVIEHPDGELDYINYEHRIAVEFTVTDKKTTETLLNKVPQGYRKLLLTRDRDIPVEDIIRVPYYQFIHKLSTDGMGYVEGLFRTEQEKERPAPGDAPSEEDTEEEYQH